MYFYTFVFVLDLDCEPGHQVDRADNTCKPCPLNTFSHGGFMASCMPCDGDGITLEEDAKSPWDCGMTFFQKI